MAETRSQTPLKIVMTDETREIALSLLVKMKETYDDYFAQMEEIFAKFHGERDRKEENPEDQICNDEESAEIEDRAVENEANSKVISAIVKEESIPQFLMVTEADSTCVQHTNVILQQVSISPLEHSLNFCKANLDVMGNCQYAMGMTHQIWSDSKFGCVNDDACQVFDEMPSKEKQRKCLKAWKFKFKTTSKRSKAMDVKFFSVEEIVWLTKDSKGISRCCVNKEFKEVVAGCKTKKQTLLIVKLANHVWKPGGFVHPKIQLDWLKRADSNHEKESNKKLRKLKLHQGGKSHKTWMFKYKSEFPRHYGFDIEALFGVEFYELEYRKLHINHCFAVQEFYDIHGSISGPWHLAFDPGGIISCAACDGFVVTHTQWVGHDKLEGCSNDQTLAIDVEVEEKHAWIENAWFKIQSMLVQKRVLLQADETIIKTDLCQLHQLQDTTVSNWAPDCVKQLQQSGNLLFQKVHEILWLTLPIPPTNQMKNVHTQIHMVQWAWHCVKHDTQQTDFHVWHRWKNKAEKLEISLVCSGKRWSFVVYAFYDHTVVLRKEPILPPKIKRGCENKIIAGMSRGQGVRQHHGEDSEKAKLHINSIKHHYTSLVGIMVLQILSFHSLQTLRSRFHQRREICYRKWACSWAVRREDGPRLSNPRGWRIKED